MKVREIPDYRVELLWRKGVLNLNKGDEYYEGMEKPGDQEGKSVLHWLMPQPN